MQQNEAAKQIADQCAALDEDLRVATPCEHNFAVGEGVLNLNM
jgi:hypothetical protein